MGNQRPSKVLFTRLDSNGNYLYGRLLVRCSLAEDCDTYGHAVLVHLLYAYESEVDCCVRPVPLAAFVVQHEGIEHAHFENVWMETMETAGAAKENTCPYP